MVACYASDSSHASGPVDIRVRNASAGIMEDIVDGMPVKLQPIDYVGETLLDPGRYTYELDYRDGHLGLELKRD